MERDRFFTRYRRSPGHYRVFHNGILIYDFDAWGPIQVPYAAQHMHDQLDQTRVGSKRKWHPVSHWKEVIVPGNVPPYIDPEFGGVYTYQMTCAPVWCHGVDAPTPDLPPGVAGRVSRSALDNALTQVPMQVSVTNFLWELRDPRALLPRVRRWASHHTAADLLLWWRFGVDPTIRDIKALLGAWTSAVKRLEHLRKVNNRVVTIRYRDGNTWVTHGDPPSGAPQWYDPMWPSPVYVMSRHSADVSVTMQVRYNLYGLDDPYAVLGTLAATLGLNNPLGIIWEAIPYSFVVDWFVAVGDLLDRVGTVQPFPGKIEVVSCYHTIKTSTDWDTYYPTTPNGDWQIASSSNVRGYFRRVGLPGGSLITDGLTPDQQMLGLALLDSQEIPSRLTRFMRGRSPL